MKPLHDNVLVERPAAPKSAAGLILPVAETKGAPTVGIVVAVGPGRKTAAGYTPVSVQPGARVLYAKGKGVEVRVDGRDMLVIPDGELLAWEECK